MGTRMSLWQKEIGRCACCSTETCWARVGTILGRFETSIPLIVCDLLLAVRCVSIPAKDCDTLSTVTSRNTGYPGHVVVFYQGAAFKINVMEPRWTSADPKSPASFLIASAHEIKRQFDVRLLLRGRRLSWRGFLKLLHCCCRFY